MLMDWWGSYDQNGHPTKSNLQTKWNYHQKSSAILNRSEKLPLTFIWQHKRLRVARTILNTKYFAGNTIIWSFVIVQKKQHGADIKIDTLINGITLKTVTWSHTLIYTWLLPKTPDIYNGEKTSSTSGIEKTGQLQVEHWN